MAAMGELASSDDAGVSLCRGVRIAALSMRALALHREQLKFQIAAPRQGTRGPGLSLGHQLVEALLTLTGKAV